MMTAETASSGITLSKSDWYRITASYCRSDTGKALWQLFNTFLPYCCLWGLMVRTVQQGYPYSTTLLLSIVAAAFMVRIFILFHDCCHGSFFCSRRANAIVGYFCGIVTFTAFEDWRYSHNLHHASAGNLDRRGVGAVRTMTTHEYLAASSLKRLAYRIYRNPVVFLGPGSALLFLLFQRFSTRGARKQERNSVIFTNMAIMIIVAVSSLIIGFKTYVLIQLPIILIGGAVGLWLFYVQHQFENVYWARDDRCDFLLVALEGSSYFKLPKVLQWFSGNIGFHHIHHLRPRIPNYELQRCYNDISAFQAIPPMTIRASLRALRLSLYDEHLKRMTSFRSLKVRSVTGPKAPQTLSAFYRTARTGVRIGSRVEPRAVLTSRAETQLSGPSESA